MENEVCFRAEICKKNKMHIILMVITVIFFIFYIMCISVYTIKIRRIT